VPIGVPVGGLTAYALSGAIDAAWSLPFAAGNFLYIGATDLIPELHPEECPGRAAPRHVAEQLVQLAAFLVGLGILLAIAVFSER
jgi:zinc and cadmium transporter